MPDRVTRNVIDRVFADIAGTAPWTVHAEWVAGTPVDRVRLADAAAATVHRHPLLRARPGPGDAWTVPDGSAAPVVTEHAAADDTDVAGERDRAVSEPFDLDREPPVRFAVIRAPATDHVLVVADHALVDGVGVARTMSSLMTAYRSGSDGGIDQRWRQAHDVTVAPPPADQVRLTVEEMQRRSRPTAVRLARQHTRDDDGSGVVYHRMTTGATRALACAPRLRWTANDVIVSAVCLAVMAHNRAHAQPPVPVSVAVPVNLRPARWWFEGVGNATLPWPVRVDADAPRAVLRQVSDQLRQVRAGRYSPAVRSVLTHLGARTSLTIRERHALATTTVVSTVPGDGLMPGDVPGDVWGGAPVPPTMGVTFGVVPVAGGHHLSARYLRSHFGAGGVAHILAAVDAAVVELCRP